MAAFTRKPPLPDDSHAELLLDDASDALVPLPVAAPTDTPPPLVNDTPDPVVIGSVCLADMPPAVLAELVAWLTRPEPSFGWRRALFLVSGINVGPCASERRLRLRLCALYRASHPSTPDHSKERSC